MKSIFKRFVKDESGATAIEYGLIASLIGVAIIVGARSPDQPLRRRRAAGIPPADQGVGAREIARARLRAGASAGHCPGAPERFCGCLRIDRR